MKSAEIRNMTKEEIDQTLLSLKERLFSIRAEKVSGGRIERPQRLREMKRDIARCLTILKEKKSEK